MNKNTNVIRIIYIYAIMHLNVISSDNLLKNVNTLIIESFVLILNGIDNIIKNAKLDNLVKKNKEYINFDISNN